MNTRLKNLEEYVQDPSKIAKDDRIVQMLIDERYNRFLIMRSGRVFKQRARGQTGAYDRWQEIDVLAEVRQDLFTNLDEYANNQN